jgi:HD-GYP domain-containing protein (c-di-GMP phosphodiesterase class II)
LSGGEVLEGAKILMVADVVEAMSSHRPYRTALGIESALAEVERGAGLQYDAGVVAACLRVFRERGFAFLEI